MLRGVTGAGTSMTRKRVSLAESLKFVPVVKTWRVSFYDECFKLLNLNKFDL